MRVHWLMIPTCVLGLSLAAQLQAQQATDSGSRQQQLEKAAQEKAQEARRMAEETQEKAEEAKTLSREARQADQRQQHRKTGQHVGRLSTAGLFRTGDLVGMEVRTRDGEEIGEIEELTIDSKNGKIAYAVISAGGFLGIGDKFVAVPWNSLQVRSGQGEQADENFLVLNAQKQDFQNAPSFSENNWPTSQDQIWQVGAEREEMDVNVEQQRQKQQHEQQMREQQQRDQKAREEQQKQAQQKQEQGQ